MSKNKTIFMPAKLFSNMKDRDESVDPRKVLTINEKSQSIFHGSTERFKSKGYKKLGDVGES